MHAKAAAPPLAGICFEWAACSLASFFNLRFICLEDMKCLTSLCATTGMIDCVSLVCTGKRYSCTNISTDVPTKCMRAVTADSKCKDVLNRPTEMGGALCKAGMLCHLANWAWCHWTTHWHFVSFIQNILHNVSHTFID